MNNKCKAEKSVFFLFFALFFFLEGGGEGGGSIKLSLKNVLIQYYINFDT